MSMMTTILVYLYFYLEVFFFTLLVAVPLFYFKAFLHRNLFHKINSEIISKNILLVIAHPDDEAMFFTPTIKHLI